MTHLSLFTGIGGLDLASEWAGFETVGQCEFADYPTKVLEKHWPHVPRWRDIRDVTAESFRERTGLSAVDLISGGFPCQPHSVIGKRKGENDERHLWPEFIRVIRAIKPTWVIGENVQGILSTIHADVCADLEREGYEVRTFSIPAYAVGAHLLATPRASQDYKPIRKQTPTEHSGKHGQTLCSSLGIVYPEYIGKYINPWYAEWLMGFPTDWADISNTKSE